jgi:hypothetical protein
VTQYRGDQFPSDQFFVTRPTLRSYFFFDVFFLVVFFVAAFFLAIMEITSFHVSNVRVREKCVNGFLNFCHWSLVTRHMSKTFAGAVFDK